MRSIISEWLGWLGVIIGSLGVISAINRIYEFGLSAFFAELLNFYRRVTGPLFDLLRLLYFDLTPLQSDILLVYLILLMMSLRAGVFPLANPEIYRSEREKMATVTTEIGDFDKDNPLPNVISASKRKDGRYDIRVFRYESDWKLYLRAFLSCLFLLPIITLLPFRRALPYRSSLGGRQWRLLWLAMRLSPEDKKKGNLLHSEKGLGRGYVSVWYLMRLRSYAVVAMQAAALPLAVILFFVLATYSPA